MKKSKWIHQNNIPVRLPLWNTILIWLLLDRLQPAGWVIGCAWTVMAILWLAAITCIANSERLEELK